MHVYIILREGVICSFCLNVWYVKCGETSVAMVLIMYNQILQVKVRIFFISFYSVAHH